MKKSIAFLGALLFGSITFGQVTKNDSIKKPSSRKVSADDLKNLPVDTETSEKTSNNNPPIGTLWNGKDNPPKGRENKIMAVGEKQDAKSTSKHLKGGMIQKGKSLEGAAATEKQHYTVKLTNANNKASASGDEPGVIKEGATTTQKKHVSNIKWSGDKVAEDPKPTSTPATTDTFLKITDVKGEKE